MIVAVAYSVAAVESSVSVDVGSNPQLPAPESKLIPTINVAPAKPWPQGMMPTAAPGFKVQAYATGLDHPHWLYVLPNGDVLVAETNAPAAHDANSGVRGAIQKAAMKKAG